MKTLNILALGLCLLPVAASAQRNVKDKFDQLIGHQKAEVSQNHSLAKDPATGAKESQCDTYSFVLPKKQLQLVKDIELAFQQDSEQAYQYVTGKRDKRDEGRLIAIAVGNGNSQGVTIGREPGTSYVYACFLAPEDTTATHRYAYAMEWKLTGKGDFVVGKLAVTYATTQAHRQANLTAGGLEGGNQKSWFDTLTSYITAMSTADMQARRALASKVYTHTKNLKDVDDADKEITRKLLEKMTEDKQRYDDAMIQELLAAAIRNLK